MSNVRALVQVLSEGKMVANEDRIDMMDPGEFGTAALSRFCWAKHFSVNDC